MPAAEVDLAGYLDEARRLALKEIEGMMPSNARIYPILYDLVLEYPLRQAKALRPALCIATCRALGGRLEAVLPSAAAIELYHNAFLVHDDVEDGSAKRRDLPTLWQAHGVPIAINVGDAMLALSLRPLINNMAILGLGKALRVLQMIARMARESAEGQAIELAWIRSGRWDVTTRDYVRMIVKKTSWYSFVTPILVGAIIAGASAEQRTALHTLAVFLGIAFQIQDDILNLVADERAYGKEVGGDLWEGKYTLVLLHAIRSATDTERGRAHEILAKRRPNTVASSYPEGRTATTVRDAIANLHTRGELTDLARHTLDEALSNEASTDPTVKTTKDVLFLHSLIQCHDSIAYARAAAHEWGHRAIEQFHRVTAWMPPSVHRDVLECLTRFVVDREW